MIRITFQEPTESQWSAWKKKCAQARTDMIRNGPPYEIDEDLYKATRDLLFAAYSYKCAYCESYIRHDQRGDVEHFRPKTRVRDENNQLVYVGKGKSRKQHPGYYWLAYDYRNLLPSCDFCNKYKKKGGGKGERFPVAGFRASRPGDEKKEKPLLLNPVREDPSRHLDVDRFTGAVFARGDSEVGKTCIQLLGLNRPGLIEARLTEYRRICGVLGNLVANQWMKDKAVWEPLVKDLRSLQAGTTAYAMIGRKAMANLSLRKLLKVSRHRRFVAPFKEVPR
jgi:hypothetical protein